MRTASYDAKARKQTVSLSLNADLFAKAKAIGINASRVAEEALARALIERQAERLRAEIRRDLAVHDAYVAEHGSFAAMAREHYAAAAEDDDAAAV